MSKRGIKIESEDETKSRLSGDSDNILSETGRKVKLWEKDYPENKKIRIKSLKGIPNFSAWGASKEQIRNFFGQWEIDLTGCHGRNVVIEDEDGRCLFIYIDGDYAGKLWTIGYPYLVGEDVETHIYETSLVCTGWIFR